MVFYVSMLQKYHEDGDYIILWDPQLFDKELSYEEEPIGILNKDMRNLRTKFIHCVKVQWRNHPIEEKILEIEADNARDIHTCS